MLSLLDKLYQNVVSIFDKVGKGLAKQSKLSWLGLMESLD
jgi:hypothetical protein